MNGAEVTECVFISGNRVLSSQSQTQAEDRQGEQEHLQVYRRGDLNQHQFIHKNHTCCFCGPSEVPAVNLKLSEVIGVKSDTFFLLILCLYLFILHLAQR